VDSAWVSLAVFEHLLDAAKGLPCALFVFDEGEAHVAVAVIAEAYAGTYCDLGFGEEFFGEVDRAEAAVLLGDFCPGEHGGLGEIDGPA